MARRNSYPGSKWYQRPDQAYARTSGWPSRYYQRKVTGSMVASLSGLNTTADDFAKREGESPYLWNARLNGTKEKRKRAQSMSRMGSEFFCVPEGVVETTLPEAGDLRVAIRENHDILWKVKTEGKTTRIGFRFSFDDAPEDDNHAHFLAIVRKCDDNRTEICRAIRPVKKIYDNIVGDQEYVEWFDLIKVPEGDFYLQCSLTDDLDDDGEPNDFTMYMNADGTGNHKYADHKLPNLDAALREEDYKWELGINRPVIGLSTCNAKPFGVWLQKGYFSRGSERWVTLGVEKDGQKMVYAQKYADININTGRYEINKNPEEMRLLIPADKINQEASQVRCTQAGNHLYFVDGYSALQRINLDDWTIDDARPDMEQVDTFGFQKNMYYYSSTIIIANGHFQRCKTSFQAGDTFNQDDWEMLDDGSSITAWPGASLIYFLNNRLFLSGFRHETVGEGEKKKAEPNLVIMSSIDSVMPRYDMFNRSIEFFYVNDVSPSQSSTSPVTAFSNVGDYLAVFTADGFVLETVQAAVEFSGISQTSPEGSQYGVMKQEHVALGRNNIYFLNPSMGVMRTAGATASVISSPIDNIIEQIDEQDLDKVYLGLTGDILRLYYSGEGNGENDCSLIDYVSIAQHKSYWFRDNNTPVSSLYVDSGCDTIIAAHSQYPCLFFVDSSYMDFDCAILYEYYTKYISTPDRLDHTIVRRIHVSTLQTFQSSIFIGLDYDHNNHPIVWRKFIVPTEPGNFAPEDIFGDDQESSATNLDIRILTTDTRFVQIRLKQYCYDFQAEILQVGFEYGSRSVL